MSFSQMISETDRTCT